ncbi:hypothetical protein KDN32_03795 [Nocardioides sp. J2M5]|nr:hypothetical protein [Nocardioides palaemonis]
MVGCCPFHDDDSPSLVVTPGKNLWHCLGACGRGGGPIDWVMTRSRGLVPACGGAAAGVVPGAGVVGATWATVRSAGTGVAVEVGEAAVAG